MSRDRFLRVHDRQVTAMLYRKVWEEIGPCRVWMVIR